MVRQDLPRDDTINPVDMDLDDEVDVGKQLEEISLKKKQIQQYNDDEYDPVTGQFKDPNDEINIVDDHDDLEQIDEPPPSLKNLNSMISASPISRKETGKFTGITNEYQKQ